MLVTEGPDSLIWNNAGSHRCAAAMEEPWNLEFVSYAVDCLLSFVTEFVQDWADNDMRVSIFKILLGWLLISLVSIHFAWKVYGITVNDMYHRQGELNSWDDVIIIRVLQTSTAPTGSGLRGLLYQYKLHWQLEAPKRLLSLINIRAEERSILYCIDFRVRESEFVLCSSLSASNNPTGSNSKE